MAKRPVKWSLTRMPEYDGPPAAILECFPRDEYTFAYFPDQIERSDTRSRADRGIECGRRPGLDAPDRSRDRCPYRYTFEADVEDVSRQHIANRASVVVHPASIYLGLLRADGFASVRTGASTPDRRGGSRRASRRGRHDHGVALPRAMDSRAPPGRQRLLHLGDREEGNPRRRLDRHDRRNARASPGAGAGGRVLRPESRGARPRRARTRTDLDFYAVGAGYTAWQRYDHNRIDLVPEKTKYRPGETARILIKSPWEKATALLTTEREGIRSWQEFEPDFDAADRRGPDRPKKDIPDVFVSVLLVRGRTSNVHPKDASRSRQALFPRSDTRPRSRRLRKRLKLAVGATATSTARPRKRRYPSR